MHLLSGKSNSAGVVKLATFSAKMKWVEKSPKLVKGMTQKTPSKTTSGI